MTGRSPATDAELNEAKHECAEAGVAMYKAERTHLNALRARYRTPTRAAKDAVEAAEFAYVDACRRHRAAVQEYAARTQSREDKP